MLKVCIYVSLSSGLATLLTLRVHDQGRSIKYPYFTLPQRRRNNQGHYFRWLFRKQEKGDRVAYSYPELVLSLVLIHCETESVINPMGISKLLNIQIVDCF